MVKNFWGYLSQSPENYFAYHHGRELIEKLIPYLPKQGAILDYGCGPGYLVEQLLETRLRVAGLDFSPDSVKSVNERFQGRKNFIGAFEPHAIPDSVNRFDAAVSIEVLEHLYDEQLNELLENLARVVRPGGTVIFTTPNEEVLEDSYIPCPVSGQLFHRWQHVRSWSRETLAAYLLRRGYSIESTLCTDLTVSFRKGKIRALKKTLKYKFRPNKKRPHLVVVARTPE
jgi:2-polyprenyl-3-methyl-5-hydroxy-6-metoxy-1,4-benzoquinol methylase